GTNNTVTIGNHPTFGPFTPLTSMTANPMNQNAYDDLGLPPQNFGGASESWKNWSALDPGVTSFGLFVYEIPNVTGGFGQKGNYPEITLNGNMPAGTFVIGFGQDIRGNDIGTPFTQAGWDGHTPPVPEPSWIVLGALGMIGLGYGQLRRLLRRKALGLA